MSRIIFLGTGNARSVTRQASGTLLSYKDHAILIDCGDGRGTVRQIHTSGIPLSSISDVFLTHRHADHISGIAHVLFYRLMEDPDAKIRVIGPAETVGVAKMICEKTHDFLRFHSDQIAFIPIRNKETVRPHPGMTVTAVKVGKPVNYPIQTTGYRIRLADTSVALTGDASPTAGFTDAVKGVDILIHECTNSDDQAEALHAGGHSSPVDAGKAARECGAKTLFLTHLPDEPRKGFIQELVHTAQQQFSGKVVAAEDGMAVEI
jgi:ribonuclease Z